MTFCCCCCSESRESNGPRQQAAEENGKKGRPHLREGKKSGDTGNTEVVTSDRGDMTSLQSFSPLSFCFSHKSSTPWLLSFPSFSSSRSAAAMAYTFLLVSVCRARLVCTCTCTAIQYSTHTHLLTFHCCRPRTVSAESTVPSSSSSS